MRIFLFSICILIVPIAAHAHGGGLNKEGCHNNRQTGDYHCHRGAKARPQAPAEPTLTGIPRIIDGDTIRIGNTRIRLHGIDAPEAKQSRWERYPGVSGSVAVRGTASRSGVI